jgi:hypothetical protein
MKIFPNQGPPKFTLNWDFWFEKKHLATLACTFKFLRKNAMLWFSPLNGRGSPFCNLNLFEKIFATPCHFGKTYFALLYRSPLRQNFMNMSNFTDVKLHMVYVELHMVYVELHMVYV